MFYEVILDAGETANKCTIAPLTYRPDFRILRVKGEDKLGPLRATVLLHPDGDCLTTLSAAFPAEAGIAAIDCVWRRLDRLHRRLYAPAPRLARIPDGFTTAYPRRSKVHPDPDAGLATIEALFIAAALLGRWDPTLLAEYFFARSFVEKNAARFLALGVREAGDPTRYPTATPRPRHSQRRRLDRGHVPPAELAATKRDADL